MEILWYKNAIDIPVEYYPSFIDKEIECWWAEPFWEYMKCSNTNCSAIYSIEDIYGSISTYHKNDKWFPKFKCDCWCKVKLIYPEKIFLSQVQEYIKWQVSAVLVLDNDENIEWFWVISKTTLWWVIRNEFNTRPNSYNKETTIKELSLEIFWEEDLEEKEVICLNHIFLSDIFRWWNTSLELIKKLLLLNTEYKDIPVVLETRYDSKFYPIISALWFKDLLHDKYWYVIKYTKSYWEFLELILNTNSFRDLEKTTHKERAKEVLDTNTSFSSRKFYK